MKTKAILIYLILIALAAGICNAEYNGGNGEPNNPYRISTAADMQQIGAEPNDWNKHFVLTDDINLAQFTGTQFNIIGFCLRCGCRPGPDNRPFTGVFDGNGFSISNFTYTGGGLIGLFGWVSDPNSEIKNLTLIDPNVVINTGVAGALVSRFAEGKIYGCSIEGGKVSETRYGGGFVGGLVGMKLSGVISDCYSTTSVLGTFAAGGLVGYNSGAILNCQANGAVSGYFHVGGLVGLHDFGTISNCGANGIVEGDLSIGGLVGTATQCTILNSYATGGVSGKVVAGGLVGVFSRAIIMNSYAAGAVDGNDHMGGFVGWDSEVGTSYTKCFWDRDINPDVNGIGNLTDPNVIGESTANMQTESTFTSVGWDFVGETANGSDDIWKMCYDPDYPHLFWEQCPKPSLEVPMHFTPRTLNPKSKGKWIKAHLVLPEGFSVEDVNTNSPARLIEPFTAESVYMDVFINEDGLVKIMAAFDRDDFCSNGSAQGNVVVIGRLTNGQYFYGTDTIRIKTNNLEYLAVLTYHWLRTDCKKPHWCESSDINQDGTVDFIDFAFFDGCCLEFIKN